MKSTVRSVFDLSPAEKLQLVEDLWDDLAANPEDVPVHDWQIAELARRKANLQRYPDSVNGLGKREAPCARPEWPLGLFSLSKSNKT